MQNVEIEELTEKLKANYKLAVCYMFYTTKAYTY